MRAIAYRLPVGYPRSGSVEVIIHSTQLRAVPRPCRAGAADGIAASIADAGRDPDCGLTFQNNDLSN